MTVQLLADVLVYIGNVMLSVFLTSCWVNGGFDSQVLGLAFLSPKTICMEFEIIIIIIILCCV